MQISPNKIIYITERIQQSAQIRSTLTLPFDARRKNSLRAQLDNGESALLALPRGTILREGDLLRGEDENMVVMVQAALETVTVAFTEDRMLFARICYQVGTHQIPVQIGENWLRYKTLSSLDEFLADKGLRLTLANEKFEPEIPADW